MASGKAQAVPIKDWPFGQWPDRLRTITDANGERGWIQVSVAECRRLLSLATIWSSVGYPMARGIAYTAQSLGNARVRYISSEGRKGW
jgi:SH3-like domain-containing protein